MTCAIRLDPEAIFGKSMPILSFIYRQWVDNFDSPNPIRKVYATFFKSIRRVVLFVADPACKMEVATKPLWMPFSHLLPVYGRPGTEYNTLLIRLADFIRVSHGRLCLIDVGANIGDTIVMCGVTDTDSVLALEPHPLYFSYLQRNFGNRPNVQKVQSVCGAEDAAPAAVEMKTIQGTAQIHQSGAGEMKMATTRLDTLLRDHPDFLSCNLLKIDTDGHDFNVLRGATNLIERAKPAVLFECDIFQNPNYIRDIEEVFKLFSKAGYHDALVYDNLGYFFCRVDLQKPESFRFALFHQLIGKRHYFDILMIQRAEEFLDCELNYFAGSARDAVYKTATKAAVEAIKTVSPRSLSA
jgi:FkbM family methyltransferase